MQNQPPYLLGRKCNGRAPPSDSTYFRLDELRTIAVQLGLPVSGVKDQVCQRIREHLNQHPEVMDQVSIQTRWGKQRQIEPVAESTAKTGNTTYQTLERILKDYDIPNIRSLVALSDDELNSLIKIIKLHDNKISLQSLVKGKTTDEKVKILIDELAQKLCRCIKKVSSDNLGESRKIAICISSIFHTKGITISGFTCEPPQLLPKKGHHSIINKKK